MPLALQLWNRVSAALKSSPRQPPSAITIARDHIDENLGGALNYSFREGQHYFQVLVNEMYLTDSRRWFTQIDPVIYAVAEFTYAGKPEIAPFLVGPNLLKEKGVPDQYGKQGMILRNTRVSGLHPYRGGGLTLTIVLCEAPVGNAIRSLLRVVESTAGALDFSPVLAPYTKVASILMDGFDALLGSTGSHPPGGLSGFVRPQLQHPFPALVFRARGPNRRGSRGAMGMQETVDEGPDPGHRPTLPGIGLRALQYRRYGRQSSRRHRDSAVQRALGRRQKRSGFAGRRSELQERQDADGHTVTRTSCSARILPSRMRMPWPISTGAGWSRFTSGPSPWA